MAIDNAEKRKSASGIQTTLISGVTNNSSKDAEWRQEAGWLYSGITILTQTVLTGFRRLFTFNNKRHILTLDDARRTFILTLDDTRRTFILT